MKTRNILIILIILMSISVSSAIQNSFTWSGMEWTARSGHGAPGLVYNWSSNNVGIDDQDRLHINITNESGYWYQGQIYSTNYIGYGTYIINVSTNVATFANNTIFGFFPYKDDDNEIDIEWGRWVNASRPNVMYSVNKGYGCLCGDSYVSGDLYESNTTNNTWKFVWNATSVLFYGNDVLEWAYYGAIPDTDSTKLHVNMWLKGEVYPDTNTTQEVVINSIQYIPEPPASGKIISFFNGWNHSNIILDGVTRDMSSYNVSVGYLWDTFDDGVLPAFDRYERSGSYNESNGYINISAPEAYVRYEITNPDNFNVTVDLKTIKNGSDNWETASLFYLMQADTYWMNYTNIYILTDNRTSNYVRYNNVGQSNITSTDTNRYAWNTIKVNSVGSTSYLYINGTLLNTLTSAKFTNLKTIADSGQLMNPLNAHSHFDNLKYWYNNTGTIYIYNMDVPAYYNVTTVKLILYNTGIDKTVDFYYKSNASSEWLLVETNISSNVEYDSLYSDFIDFKIVLNGKLDGDAPIFNSLVWDGTYTPPPTINYIDNNYTNNQSQSFSAINNTNISFNIGSDQIIDNWYWSNSSIISGNGTTNSSAAHLFNTVGVYTISVNGTNVNGTTQTITWTINITNPPPTPTPTPTISPTSTPNTGDGGAIIIVTKTPSPTVTPFIELKDSTSKKSTSTVISNARMPICAIKSSLIDHPCAIETLITNWTVLFLGAVISSIIMVFLYGSRIRNIFVNSTFTIISGLIISFVGINFYIFNYLAQSTSSIYGFLSFFIWGIIVFIFTNKD